MKDIVDDQWDATFIDNIALDLQTLYDVILASNYMDINGLICLGCAKVATLIKGVHPARLKDVLNPRSAINTTSRTTDAMTHSSNMDVEMKMSNN